MKGDPQSHLLQVLGVSWTTHCFSAAVTHCHSLSTSCPPPPGSSPGQRWLLPCKAGNLSQASSAPHSSPGEGGLLSRDPPPTAVLFPSEPASSGSNSTNAFWALSLPSRGLGSEEPPSLHAACDSPSLASACPHLRDHDVSLTPMPPTGQLPAGHACRPQNVPGMRHETDPSVHSCPPSPGTAQDSLPTLNSIEMGPEWASCFLPPIKCLLLTSRLCGGLLRTQLGPGFNLLLSLQEVQLQLRDAKVLRLP